MMHTVCNILALPFRLGEWARIQAFTLTINALLGPEDGSELARNYVSRTTVPRDRQEEQR
jgi:hypothetical protein